MSKSKSPQDSWKAWGEFRKERDRLKDVEDWKREALEDMADNDETTTVYAVMNGWQVDGADVAEGVYYTFTETFAYNLLADRAHDHGIALDPNQSSFGVYDSDIGEIFYIDSFEVEK